MNYSSSESLIFLRYKLKSFANCLSAKTLKILHLALNAQSETHLDYIERHYLLFEARTLLTCFIETKYSYKNTSGSLNSENLSVKNKSQNLRNSFPIPQRSEQRFTQSLSEIFQLPFKYHLPLFGNSILHTCN